jgi:hypothetical protein
MKENKFASAMLGVAFAAFVAIYFFSGSKSTAYEDAKEEYDRNALRYSQLSRTKPFPSPASLTERKKEVSEYRTQVEELQAELVKFRPEKFVRISPSEFTTRVKEVATSLKEKYDGSGIAYPEKWQAGFEEYTSGVARDDATNYLNYQLEAFNWLFETLITAGPTELSNVYRPRLAVEDGKPMWEAPMLGRRPDPNAVEPPYHALPVELTFLGSESSLRNFLVALANADAEKGEPFFMIRSVRVQNTRADEPPKKSDATFKAAPVIEEEDPFGDFGFPGEDADPGGEGVEPEEDGGEPVPLPDFAPQPAGGEQILGRILGGEELYVFLQLELVFFRDEVELPEVK